MAELIQTGGKGQWSKSILNEGKTVYYSLNCTVKSKPVDKYLFTIYYMLSPRNK